MKKTVAATLAMAIAGQMLMASDTTVLTRAVTKLIKEQYQVNTQINDIKKALEKHNKEIDTNRQNIAELKTDIDSVKRKMEEAARAASYAKKTTGEVTSSAAAAYQRVLKLERKVRMLEESVKKMGANVSMKNGCVKAKELDEKDARIAKLEREIELLKRKVEKNESAKVHAMKKSDVVSAPCCTDTDTEADKIIREYINSK